MADDVKIVIKAVDEASKTLEAVRKSIEGTGKGAEETGGRFKALGLTLTDIQAGFQLAGQAAQKFKQAYDFVREGAQIEYNALKFDRLAESIGTTGEALETELFDAMDGLVSRTDAVAAATDFMGLGLAKTQDKAVRMASVSAQLSMDLNELVLTLTNQTTRRFDQLGVSVEGFDERLQALKDSGMDVNDAFTEAFLQQAEAQIERVGSVSDTTLGKMQKLEAGFDNLKTMALEFAVDAAEPMIDSIIDSSDAIQTNADAVLQATDSYEDYKKATLDLKLEMGYAGRAIPILSEEIWTNAKRAYEAEEAIKRFDEAIVGLEDPEASANLGVMANAVSGVGDAADEAAEKMIALIDSFAEVESKRQAKETLDKLNEAFSAGDLTMQEYQSAYAEIATQWLGMSSDAVKAQFALQAIEQDYSDGKLTALEYKQAVRELLESLNALDGTTANTYVITNFRSNGNRPALGGGDKTSEKKYGGATGLSMIIPPGYPNDTFGPFYGTSGERIDILTPGQQGQQKLSGGSVPAGGGNISIGGDSYWNFFDASGRTFTHARATVRARRYRTLDNRMGG